MPPRGAIVAIIIILLWPVVGIPSDRSVHLATLNWEPYIGEEIESNGFGAEILRQAFNRAGTERVRQAQHLGAGKYIKKAIYFRENRLGREG